MVAEAETIRALREPEVLQAAADIRRGDQVAFVSVEGGASVEVGGGVTGVRRSPDGDTVAVVVDNRVHFVPSDRLVVIVRGPQDEPAPRATRWSR